MIQHAQATVDSACTGNSWFSMHMKQLIQH